MVEYVPSILEVFWSALLNAIPSGLVIRLLEFGIQIVNLHKVRYG
jgi:hypothetical protein